MISFTFTTENIIGVITNRVDFKSVINGFKISLQGQFKARFSSFILFGSFARGDASEDPDVDVLFVLNKTDSKKDYFKEALPIFSQFLIKYGLYFSSITKTKAGIKNQNSRILSNIASEGIRCERSVQFKPIK